MKKKRYDGSGLRRNVMRVLKFEMSIPDVNSSRGNAGLEENSLYLRTFLPGPQMFQNASTLKSLREAFIDTIRRSEYFIGIHAFFDGEVIFARDIVHVDFEGLSFPSGDIAVWDWIRMQFKGTSGQETFHYEMAFKVDDEDDLAMKKLIEISKDSGSTIWMYDFASHDDDEQQGKRFIAVTAPDKRRAKSFKDQFDGRDLAAPL